MKIKFEWEIIDTEHTSRAKVIGGWLVRTHNSAQGMGNWSITETTTFIPDQNHEWEV